MNCQKLMHNSLKVHILALSIQKNQYTNYSNMEIQSSMVTAYTVVIPCTYKFLTHVNFEDVTNLAFLRFYFQESLSILLSDWCKSKFCWWNFEDENFTDCQLTTKTSKITSLENLYIYSIHTVYVCITYMVGYFSISIMASCGKENICTYIISTLIG